MKTAFAILIFISLQTPFALSQEVTAPPAPPPSCNAPKYNPSLGFLSTPDAAYDEGQTTGSIAAAPPIAIGAQVLPKPKTPDVKKAAHHRKKHKKHKKNSPSM